MDTNEWLERVKEKLNLQSDYALAKVLHVSKQTVSQYRSGRARMGGGPAMRVAEILEVAPSAVLMSLEAEKDHDPVTKRKWRKLAEAALRGTALALLLCTMLAAPPAHAAVHKGALCIMLNFVRRAFRRPRRLRDRAGWLAWAV